MKALWKGAISFGLVTIQVSLYPATRREELKFRLLRKSDLSPVDYKRIAEADGKEVPWDQIVKGYESSSKMKILPALMWRPPRR
jgi:DNA end-binding protein Ku